MSSLASKRLEAFVRRQFTGDADAMIERLGDLQLALAEKQNLERIQAAVVLLTRGRVERFEDNARLAERDWRDVLVWSGLGQSDWPERLDAELGPSDRAG